MKSDAKDGMPGGVGAASSRIGRGSIFVGAPSISVQGSRPRGIAFLRDAFRPMYLGGALFAAIAVPLWLTMWYHGRYLPSLPPIQWHMHEMVFGFAVAIIVGFLFTAARNWTGAPLPAGVSLGSIVLLWVVARLGMFFAYGVGTAVVDSLLLVVVASVLARRFLQARSYSNLPLVGVLSGLAACNVASHAAMLGWIGLAPNVPIELGLMLVVLVELIIAGRVVPAFTANAIPGIRQFRATWLRRLAFTATLVAFLSDTLGLPAAWTGSVAILASGAVAGQALGWNPFRTLARPMLWVLHAGYAWIAVGLFLLGLVWLGSLPRSAAIHAFAAGSIGCLVMGMVTRTSLAHSGRPVRAGWPEVTSYVLVLLAALLRVGAALVPPWYAWALLVAGAAWLLAFGIYAIAYAPLLVRGRPLRSARAT